MLIPGTVLLPGARAPITMQGQAFLPMVSMPMLFPGAPVAPAHMKSTGAPLQSAAIPPMAGAPWLNQSTLYPSSYMAPPAWPMYMPSYLPQPQVQQSSTQAEREQFQELEARE